MNPKYSIKNQIERIGNTTYLMDGDWISSPFKSCLFHLWRKTRSLFERELTPIGTVGKDYYVFICSFEHNILALSDDAVIIADDKRFSFKKREAIMIDDTVLYYEATVRKIEDEEDETDDTQDTLDSQGEVSQDDDTNDASSGEEETDDGN